MLKWIKFEWRFEMKNVIKLSLVAFLATNVYANWDEFLKGSGNKDNILHDDGRIYDSGQLYNAKVTYQFTKYNNNQHHDDTDRVWIRIESSDGKVTETPRTGLTKDELTDWGKEHADGLIKAIYGGDPTATMSGQATSSVSSATQTEQLKMIRTLSTNFSSKVLMNSESSSVKNKGEDGDSSAGVINYAKNLSNGDKFGFLTTYRYTKVDDHWGSKSGNLSFIPFWTINNQINDRFDIATTINLNGSVVYLESSIFPDGGGYLEYGGGAGVMPRYKITDSLSVDASLGYQYSKKYIPSSKVPEELEFVADAINNLEAMQTVNYGVGAEYHFTQNWRANVDILQVKQLATDDLEEGRDKATYYTIQTQIDLYDWTLGLGYKIVEDVKDYEESSYMATIKYNW